MKRYFSIALTIVLLIMTCSAWAESESSAIEFDTVIIDGMDYSLDEWLSSESNRAILSVLLLAELSRTGITDTASYLFNDSYIGALNSTVILFIGYSDSNTISIFYDTVLQKAQYAYHDSISDSASPSEALRLLVKSTCKEYYKNDKKIITKVVQALSDYVSD